MKIVEELYHFDEPILFTANRNDELHIFMLHDRQYEGDYAEYVITKTRLEVITAVKEGRLSVLGAMTDSEPVIGIYINGEETETRKLNSGDQLSTPGVGLYVQFGEGLPDKL